MGARFRLRTWLYDLEANLLALPAAVLAALGGLGLGLPALEASGAWPGLTTLGAWVAPEAGTAQLVLATMAGAIMTVISVVYSILIVALSMLSVQFSTRVLAGFTRDRLSRFVLGLFVGTFAYDLAVVSAIRTDPPRVPGVAFALGLALAFLSLGMLVAFIHHIVRSIQANVLIDRIASDTLGVLDAVFPADGAPSAPCPPPGPFVVRATTSGYVQLIDLPGLAEASPGGQIVVLRPHGSFVAAGVPLCGADREIDAARAVSAFDLGVDRTMQDDAEFGFRQIVDIALKALSPAVNDPSTAVTVIDHLGRLLIHVARRPLGPIRVAVGAGAVFLPRPSWVDLLDLSVEQIRQVGASDMAVALRLMRVLGELAPMAVEAGARARILWHADRIRDGVASRFVEGDREELERRYAVVRAV